MATIQEALHAKLVATSAVTALVSTRIYPEGSAQATGPEAAAYVTYEAVSGMVINDHDGASGLRRSRISFMAHAVTRASVVAVCEALIDALNGYSGTVAGVSGVTIGHCLCVGDGVDFYDPDLRQQLRVVDFDVLYKE